MAIDDFALQYPYDYPINGCFIVTNIVTDSNKTLYIFNYPIPIGTSRDLLRIPFVDESAIRTSLLKGTLRNKIIAREIEITCSDIDLLQFNATQKQFLQAAGVTEGLQVGPDQLTVYRKEDIELSGTVDDVNTVFSIPIGTFLQNNDYKIIVYKNGVKQFFLDDYFIAESGGPGTGYDTVIFVVPPATTPTPIDIITADYYQSNT